MDKEIGSSVNSLLKTDKCSPLVVYIVFAIIAGVTLYNNYNIILLEPFRLCFLISAPVHFFYGFHYDILYKYLLNLLYDSYESVQ